MWETSCRCSCGQHQHQGSCHTVLWAACFVKVTILHPAIIEVSMCQP
jgi:hypothetical protein